MFVGVFSHLFGSDLLVFVTGIEQDPAQVLEMGHPGRIFRSKLSHPEDLYPKGHAMEKAPTGTLAERERAKQASAP